jgi:hypothetical protein
LLPFMLLFLLPLWLPFMLLPLLPLLLLLSTEPPRFAIPLRSGEREAAAPTTAGPAPAPPLVPPLSPTQPTVGFIALNATSKSSSWPACRTPSTAGCVGVRVGVFVGVGVEVGVGVGVAPVDVSNGRGEGDTAVAAAATAIIVWL